MGEEKKYPKIEQLSFRKLGTEIDLQIVVGNSEQAAGAQKDFREIQENYDAIEKIFSRFDANSELSLLNKNLGTFQKASAEIIAITQKSIFYNNLTEGLFDPRIIEALESAGYDRTFDEVCLSEKDYEKKPEICQRKLSEDLLVDPPAGAGKICFRERMDFSGIVKGYATDQMAKILSQKGWKNFLVDSGGDIFFAGLGADGKKWRIDIEGIPEKSLMLELSEEGVATSGIGKRKWERSGKRFHHIVNPKDPEHFSFDLQSVSVISPTVEEADVWAKTLFLMGMEKAKKVAQEKSLACVILEYSGRAWISSAVKKYIFKQ